MPKLAVLLVDDYQPFCKLIYTMLEGTDFTVVGQASDGLEALQKAKELQPDLILLDVGLPHLNGIEVARRVRSVAPAAKILFLSQEGSAEVVREALGQGSRVYVHKSRTQRDLLFAIDACVRGEHFVSDGLLFGEDQASAPQHHEAQFYSDDSILLQRASVFVGNALEHAGAAVVFATEPHREGIRQNLEQRGLDIDRAIQCGTFTQLDAADILAKITVNGVPDRSLFSGGLTGLIESSRKAVKAEQSRVAVFGECVGLLYARGDLHAAISLEQAGNDLIKKRNLDFVDILCAYPSLDNHEDDPAIKRICAEHSGVRFQ